jgi:cytochrome P450
VVEAIPGPRWKRPSAVRGKRNQLEMLQSLRRKYGDIVCLSDRSSLFRQIAGCEGCVAVFGAQHTEAVLTRSEVFHTPPPLARQLGLPPTAQNLSSGLFSMNGTTHEERRSWFTPLFNRKSTLAYQEEIAAGCGDFFGTWVPGATVELLSEMRHLALSMLGRVLFARKRTDADDVSPLVETLLALRRAIGETDVPSQRGQLTDRLIECGERLDGWLRARIRECRDGSAGPGCLLSRMCAAPISDDELVGHATAMLLAGSEPVAVCLTWTLLLLSQVPELEAELAGHAGSKVEWVVKESLRLFPPNAIMMRLTAEPCELGGHLLPANCEVILSPWVSHRDPERFPRPDHFIPGRWAAARPSRFEFLPFGAGSRHCLGSQLAMEMVTAALQTMLARYRLVHVSDQVSWKISITLMPASDILVRLCPRRE